MQHPIHTPAFWQGIRTIAIVGAKDKPHSDVDRVGRYLIAAGFTVIPVHPARKEVWGLPAYPTLLEVQEQVDMVNLFRAPQYCLDHAQEVLRMSNRPKVFWMQLGISNSAVPPLLTPHSIVVVENRCSMVVHAEATGGRAAPHGAFAIDAMKKPS
ncbi:CoA-binding protein [Desulfovibrio cuneatus]|uniref:CoA-binding protein n=1 Tax=Desulfovibrio cuneatus TaxID=159728 RepID=UPI0003F54FB6|nr:CoA-binding protein [Desulfovibrio cuneatus]